MRSLFKLILINIFIAFLASGIVWAVDDTNSTTEYTDTDSPTDIDDTYTDDPADASMDDPADVDTDAPDDADTDDPADVDMDDADDANMDDAADADTDDAADTDSAADSGNSRWNWEKAKAYAEKKGAEFKAKMEECKAIRSSVKECIQASGVDFRAADKENIKSTVDECLMEAGIDVEARRAEAEARKAKFEAMMAEFEATAAAINLCMQENGLFDLSTFTPDSINVDAIKETMDICLHEAGVDLDALKLRFDSTD